MFSVATPIWSGANYNYAAKTQLNLAIDYLKKYEIDFKDISQVLDIGSGDGGVSEYIAGQNKNLKLTGIDSSISMINAAKLLNKSSNIEFHHMSAENIMLDEDSFDLVVSFSTLHWIKRQDVVFSQIFRLMKKGTRFLGFLYPVCGEQHKSTTRVLLNNKYKNFFDKINLPFYSYTPSFYKDLCKENGFGIRDISLNSSNYIKYVNVDQFAMFLKSWLPYQYYVPFHLRDALIYDIAQDRFEHQKQAKEILLETIEIDIFKK